MKRKLYFAYGANTNIGGMSRRCRQAKPLCPARLKGWRLVFRHVADVQPHPGSEVHGVLWSITPEDERALDAFEGYPTLYVKALVHVRYRGRDEQVMVYVMRERSWLEPPGAWYEDTLRTGYEQFALPIRQLDDAIAHAQQSSAARKPQVEMWGDWDDSWLKQWRRDRHLIPKVPKPPKVTRLHEVAELPKEHRK